MAAGRRLLPGDEYVLHVASPFPESLPKHEDELIVPAREGTLRLLRAARDAGVKRVVLTSSFAAIGYGHPAQTKPFDETDWTDPTGADVRPYVKSKTIAERAAWEFIAREGRGLELSVVNPVGVFGPVLGPDFYSTSILIVQRLMDAPSRVYRRFVSASSTYAMSPTCLHLRAMTSPQAKGERFLAVAGDFLSMRDIANILRSRLGEAARRVPRWQLPNWVVRLAALRDPAVKQIIPELGKTKNATNEKARRVLGWNPRSNEEAIVATAESLIRLGLLKGGGKKSA